MSQRKLILCIDFDGVIHSYERGWQDGVIYGTVTSGFWEWALEAEKYFRLMVYSSRSKSEEQHENMRAFLAEDFSRWASTDPANGVPDWLEFAHEKPPAFLSVDDRALTFRGDWGEFPPEKLRQFKTWTEER